MKSRVKRLETATAHTLATIEAAYTAALAGFTDAELTAIAADCAPAHLLQRFEVKTLESDRHLRRYAAAGGDLSKLFGVEHANLLREELGL